MIHFFTTDIGGIELPPIFTCPFHYTPHPLTLLAAEEVQAYLKTRTDWQEELSHGKMFGVLIVRTPEGNVGYLAAFSGNLAGSNLHDFFVPPVYDLLQPGDFFKVEETNISAINHRIKEMETSSPYQSLIEEVKQVHASADAQLASAREELKQAKKQRDAARKLTTDESELKALISESQFQKAEFKRLERRLKEEVALKDDQLQHIKDQISALKQERKTRSAALQLKLFEHFRMLNAYGEEKDLCTIFEETRQSTPPAGAGECALPKMLQYAYLNHLQPLAMGEFWWGESPKDEIRHHGQFYPSCKGKCEPILKHMLIGLPTEKNPLEEDSFRNAPLKIVYEDDWIVVVDKPAGMLSTPGKNDLNSISQRLHERYPEATGPLLVHRLDMATSGLLLAGKTKEIHAQLQTLFETRQVRKVYNAILDGIPSKEEGCIDLPLCPNPLDRPRQMVSFEHGKKAVTLYKVLDTKNREALVRFDLQTGRTHQIRMHAAHQMGLNCPIKGDELYGKRADRLYLHATELEFVHPVTGKNICLKSEVPFHL